jgi:hypothetical protein
LAAYREAMAGFAAMGTMAIWYAHLDEDRFMDAVQTAAAKSSKESKKAAKAAKRAEKTVAKAHTRDSLQALSKLGELVDGQYRIVSQPPIVVPARDLQATYGLSADQMGRMLREQVRAAYRPPSATTSAACWSASRWLIWPARWWGVGSVGTRAFIVLLQGRDQGDPLFLQVKEATRSVLEDHLPKSRHKQHGQRVVDGQRMMQAASDIFLG